MKIIVVEDDPALAKACWVSLRHAGHETQCAHTLGEAVSVIPVFEPAVAILDLGLPDSNGDSAVRTLSKIFPNLAIIVFSADPMWASKCLDDGAVSYLVKGDVTPMDLPAAVERAVQRQSAVQVLDRYAQDSWTESTDPNISADRIQVLANELKSVGD